MGACGRAVVLMAVAVLMAACGNKTSQEADEADSTAVETTAATEEKHSAEYIQQRIEGIYKPYENPKYDASGMRQMEPRGPLDSLYLSSRYKAVLAKAEEVAGEDNIVLDCDHWTNSQDDNNFTCKVRKVRDITDLTAVVEVEAVNFDKPYTITLALLFERGDWYVDDFISEGGSSEKKMLEDYIDDTIVEKIRTFYEDVVFYGKDELDIEGEVKKHCTPELAKRLKDNYDYDGEGYAIWDFRGKDWGPGDSDAHKVDNIKPLGNGNYKVEYRDGGQKMSCTVAVIVREGKILFADIK